MVNEVEFVSEVKYAESVWIKVRGERGGSALYIGCVCMSTDGTGIQSLVIIYLRKMSLLLNRSGKLFCLEILMTKGSRGIVAGI